MKNSLFAHWSALSLIAATCFLPGIAQSIPAEPSSPGVAAASEPAKPTEPSIDQDARKLLQDVEKAYDALKSAEFVGEVSVNIDIPTEAHKTNQQFTSSYGAPNLFKHQIEEGLLMGSDGGEVYIYNDEANSYLSMELPPAKVEMRNLPIVVPQVLQSQNPSLLFALSKNGIAEVTRSFSEIKKGTDLVLEAVSYPVLVFCSDDQESELHIAVDPKSHLIRRFTIDFKPALAASGMAHVQNAEVVVDYKKTAVNPEQASDEFAWAPPEGAFNVREPAGAARPEKVEKEMEGTEAPNFRLTSLDGTVVTLAQLRGKIVVLDFWATWSPPSAKSLPKVADLSSREAENDVRVFAINIEEEQDKVKTYMDLKQVVMPVLLDKDGKVAKSYEVKTIPQTIVIGKDGVIRKIIIGDIPDREEQIMKAVTAAKETKTSAR